MCIYIYIYHFFFFDDERREEERDFPKWNWDLFSVVENDNGRINYQLFVLFWVFFLLLLMLCHVCAV